MGMEMKLEYVVACGAEYSKYVARRGRIGPDLQKAKRWKTQAGADRNVLGRGKVVPVVVDETGRVTLADVRSPGQQRRNEQPD